MSGTIAQQKVDDGRDLFRLPEPLHGQPALKSPKRFFPLGLRAPGADEWRIDGTGTNCVHTNPIRGKLEGKGLGERVESCFSGGIVGSISHPHDREVRVAVTWAATLT